MIKVNSSGIIKVGMAIGPLLVNFNPLFYAFTSDNLINYSSLSFSPAGQ